MGERNSTGLSFGGTGGGRSSPLGDSDSNSGDCMRIGDRELDLAVGRTGDREFDRECDFACAGDGDRGIAVTGVLVAVGERIGESGLVPMK